MWFIPIHIAPIEIQIQAPRTLVFQTLTAFGTTSESGASSKVLSRDDGRLLVEFKTPVPLLFGKRKLFRTVEWVTPDEPEGVGFEEVEGPFAIRRERLTLGEEGGGTCLRYEAEFGVKGWVLGWLLGVLFIRPQLKRAVWEHMREMKKTIEVEVREK